jgi:hypothetical protein
VRSQFLRPKRGKTCQTLLAAQFKRREGVDVVIGAVARLFPGAVIAVTLVE